MCTWYCWWKKRKKNFNNTSFYWYVFRTIIFCWRLSSVRILISIFLITLITLFNSFLSFNLIILLFNRFGYCTNTMLKIIAVCDSSTSEIDLKEVYYYCYCYHYYYYYYYILIHSFVIVISTISWCICMCDSKSISIIRTSTKFCKISR